MKKKAVVTLCISASHICRRCCPFFSPGEWTTQGTLLNELASARSMNMEALESLVLLRFVGIQNGDQTWIQPSNNLISAGHRVFLSQ